MACDITKGRIRVCKDSIGGNSKFYPFNYLEDAFTIVDGVATAVNPSLTAVFSYDLEGDGNTLIQNFVGERANGTSINTQTLTLVLKQMDASTSAEMNLVVKGYPMGVVKDRNGNYHLIGSDDGIDFTVDASTGGAKTDLNGYTLTGISTTGAIAPILDEATVTAFLALVA
tara:strand:- start:1141 stop:1653 length:513 start_codon:yes stop_codon:yes gene_type:complete